MADIPAKFPEWGSVFQTQTTIEGDIDNRQEPPEEYKDSGTLFQENLPYPYVNYQFNLIDEWIQNLSERAYGVIGDVYMTSASPTVGTLATRFGGTWTARGSDTVGTASVNVYERTG